MKNLFRMVPLVLLTTAGSAAYPAASAREHPAPVVSSHAADAQVVEARLDIDYCYNHLSPYSTWVRLDPYGYVWRPPNMGYRWRPYSEGHRAPGTPPTRPGSSRTTALRPPSFRSSSRPRNSN